jgi:hypothetical protein
MTKPAFLKDLRVGSVIRDGRTTYKILSKSPGAILVERTGTVTEMDTSVMPAVEVEVERKARIHVAPTARLADFRDGT